MYERRGTALLCGVGVVARSWRGSVDPPRSLCLRLSRHWYVCVPLSNFFCPFFYTQAQPNLILSNLNLTAGRLTFATGYTLFADKSDISSFLIVYGRLYTCICIYILTFLSFSLFFFVRIRTGAKLFKIWKWYFNIRKINTLLQTLKWRKSAVTVLLSVLSSLMFSNNHSNVYSMSF